jgi:hypothetical protein
MGRVWQVDRLAICWWELPCGWERRLSLKVAGQPSKHGNAVRNHTSGAQGCGSPAAKLPALRDGNREGKVDIIYYITVRSTDAGLGSISFFKVQTTKATLQEGPLPRLTSHAASQLDSRRWLRAHRLASACWKALPHQWTNVAYEASCIEKKIQAVRRQFQPLTAALLALRGYTPLDSSPSRGGVPSPLAETRLRRLSSISPCLAPS